VTHNGAATWKLFDPGGFYYVGVDHSAIGAGYGGITLHVGDHVVMSCWVKTTGSNPGWFTGNARMGFDWWTTTQGPNHWDRIGAANNLWEAKTGLLDDSHDLDADSYVPWGQDWTHIVWDFYVQSRYTSDGQAGTATWPRGTVIQADAGLVFVPWIQILKLETIYTAYFSDFQFYINP
jgi:hypothetical protein